MIQSCFSVDLVHSYVYHTFFSKPAIPFLSLQRNNFLNPFSICFDFVFCSFFKIINNGVIQWNALKTLFYTEKQKTFFFDKQYKIKTKPNCKKKI